MLSFALPIFFTHSNKSLLYFPLLPTLIDFEYGRKFIGVASLSYETPPGLEEASQRYRLVVGGAPPKIPSSWFEFPKVSSKNETSSVAALLGLPMDSDGEQLLRTSAETLSSTIEDMNIPVNPQDLIVEWSVASSLHMNR